MFNVDVREVPGFCGAHYLQTEFGSGHYESVSQLPILVPYYNRAEYIRYIKEKCGETIHETFRLNEETLALSVYDGYLEDEYGDERDESPDSVLYGRTSFEVLEEYCKNNRETVERWATLLSMYGSIAQTILEIGSDVLYGVYYSRDSSQCDSRMPSCGNVLNFSKVPRRGETQPQASFILNAVLYHYSQPLSNVDNGRTVHDMEVIRKFFGRPNLRSVFIYDCPTFYNLNYPHEAMCLNIRSR